MDHNKTGVPIRWDRKVSWAHISIVLALIHGTMEQSLCYYHHIAIKNIKTMLIKILCLIYSRENMRLLNIN